jgi:hypothetical protein
MEVYRSVLVPRRISRRRNRLQKGGESTMGKTNKVAAAAEAHWKQVRVEVELIVKQAFLAGVQHGLEVMATPKARKEKAQ